MREADAPSTEEVVPVSCARPTGDRYVRTTDAPAQRIKGAKLKAAPDRSKDAARGIIKGGARIAPSRLAKVAGERCSYRRVLCAGVRGHKRLHRQSGRERA
jgi:hypothetical protein